MVRYSPHAGSQRQSSMRKTALFFAVLIVCVGHTQAVAIQSTDDEATFIAELKKLGPLVSSPYQTGRTNRGIAPLDPKYMRNVARLDDETFKTPVFKKMIPGFKTLVLEMARMHRVASGKEELVPLTPSERKRRARSIQDSFAAGFGDASAMDRVADDVAAALTRWFANKAAAEEGLGQLMQGVTGYWDTWLPRIKDNGGPKNNEAKLGLRYEDLFVRSTLVKLPSGPSHQHLTITNRTGKRLRNAVVMIESHVCSGKKGNRWYFYFPVLSSSAKLSPGVYDKILKTIPQMGRANWLSRNFSKKVGEPSFTLSLWSSELTCEGLVLGRSDKLKEKTKTTRERGIINVVTESTTRVAEYSPLAP